MESRQQRVISLIRELSSQYMRDRILLFAIVVVSILTVGNFFNKLFLGFEPLQYSFFSYDKILHFLASIIIVRILYRILIFLEIDRIKQPRLIASILTLILYGLIWEPFELFTFVIQESRNAQFWSEVFDVPLDWLYDIAGVLLSNYLGYD
jgi:hypothetical protein